MNFPVDKRSPVIKVVEIESRQGEQFSSWELYAQFPGKFDSRLIFAISPQSCTYSFTKSSAIFERNGKFCQYYMTKISKWNVIRLYEFLIEWDHLNPAPATTKIVQISQKCLLASQTSGTLRFLRGDNLKIKGA